jgi:hypothetical protein
MRRLCDGGGLLKVPLLYSVTSYWHINRRVVRTMMDYLLTSICAVKQMLVMFNIRKV